MQSYIIRVYREERDNPRGLVGIVEEVGAEGKRAFTTLDELWDILNARESASPIGKVVRRRSDRQMLERTSNDVPDPLGNV
ncbi:MAG: hypothetical protein AB1805_10675 [Nitrospirota bacterium]